VSVSKNEEFQQGHSPICPELGCNDPADSHIHFSQQDIDSFRGWAQAGAMAGAMDHHLRTAPTNVDDHAALQAHMLSSGHYAHHLDVQDMTHKELQAHHEEDHAIMDAGPADERENYTNLGNEHMHNE